jgi:hypothetical protein
MVLTDPTMSEIAIFSQLSEVSPSSNLAVSGSGG